MDKFLNQFKDNLENQPSPEFDEQDWADMQQLLNEQNKDSSKSVNYWSWATVALLLLMIGSNSFILKKLGQADKQIHRLESTIDTLLLTRVINRTDTIYQLINTPTIPPSNLDFINKNISQKTAPKNSSLFNQLHLHPLPSFTKVEQQVDLLTSSQSITSLLLQKASLINTNALLRKKEEPNTSFSLLKPIDHVVPPLPSKNYQPFPSFSATQSPFIKRKKSFRQLLYPMRPKGIELGLSYGFGLSLADYHKDQKIKQWEVLAQIKFSQPVRLFIVYGYKNLNYESIKMGEKYGVPELAPSQDNFEFEEANFDQRIYSISTGLQYHFLAHKKWQSYIGLGYGLSRLTKNEILYSFKEPGTTNHSAAELANIVYDKANNLPFTIFKSGINYQWNDRFSIQLEGSFLHRIEHFNNQLPNILTTKMGASYSF